MKMINKGETIKEENVFMITEDIKKLRKRDVRGMAANQMIFVASTKQLFCSAVERIANKYPDKIFTIEHDGIIKVKIKYDDHLIFEGDYYDIERFYQESYFAFEKFLMNQIK